MYPTYVLCKLSVVEYSVTSLISGVNHYDYLNNIRKPSSNIQILSLNWFFNISFFAPKVRGLRVQDW
jgi:hypothetical protein